MTQRVYFGNGTANRAALTIKVSVRVVVGSVYVVSSGSVS